MSPFALSEDVLHGLVDWTSTRPQDCLQVQWRIHAEAKKEVLVLALRSHAVWDRHVLQSWHTSLGFSLTQR